MWKWKLCLISLTVYSQENKSENKLMVSQNLAGEAEFVICLFVFKMIKIELTRERTSVKELHSSD